MALRALRPFGDQRHVTVLQAVPYLLDRHHCGGYVLGCGIHIRIIYVEMAGDLKIAGRFTLSSLLPSAAELRLGDRVYVAWKLKEARDLRDFTLSQFAAEVSRETAPHRRNKGDFSKEAARGWRNGAVPEDYTIRAIAKVLGCPESFLFEATPGVTPPPTSAVSETELLAHNPEARIREAHTRAASGAGKKRGGHGKQGG